ncbi:MAG: hypothetical protein JSS61_02800 [Verrucomicrobia bacterium]|nr:hypothetical protein [Verrucomicrobiota bacterium]
MTIREMLTNPNASINETIQLQADLLADIPVELRQEFYNLIYTLNGSPQTDDPNWGREHVFDSLEIFADAMTTLFHRVFPTTTSPVDEAVRAAFNHFPAYFQNAVYGEIYRLNGNPQTDDPRWGENHVFDNTAIFEEALMQAHLNVSGRAIGIYNNLPLLLDAIRQVTDRVQEMCDLFDGLPTEFQNHVLNNPTNPEEAKRRLFVSSESSILEALNNALHRLPLEQHCQVARELYVNTDDAVFFLRDLHDTDADLTLSVANTPDPRPPHLRIEELREAFSNLPESIKNYVYGEIYYRAGSPETDDLNWGRTHAFDDLITFSDIMCNVLELTRVDEDAILRAIFALLQIPLRSHTDLTVYASRNRDHIPVNQLIYIAIQVATNHAIHFPSDATPRTEAEEVLDQSIRRNFWNLPTEFKNHVYAAIYRLNNRRDPTDPLWGKNHVFDSTEIFYQAIEAACHQLPLRQHAQILQGSEGHEFLSGIHRSGADLTLSVENDPDPVIFPFNSRPTEEEFRHLFSQLPEEMRNYVHEMVYYLHRSPETDDLNWGRNHAFDDMSLFWRAMKCALLEVFDEQRIFEILNMPWLEDEDIQMTEAYRLRNPQQMEFLSDDLCLRYLLMHATLERGINLPDGARPINPYPRIPGAVAYGYPYPGEVGPRAEEIHSLKAQLDERYLNLLDAPEIPADMRDYTGEYMEIPVFDSSHPGIARDVANTALRHTLDQKTMNDQINCPVCRVHSINHENLMIDKALQERILNHLRAAVLQPVEEVPTAPSGADYIREALQMHSSTSTASNEIARAVILRALSSTEPLTPLNTPEFMHRILGLLEPARKKGREDSERLIPVFIRQLKTNSEFLSLSSST